MTDNLDYEINKELGECYLFMGEMEKAEDYYNKAADNNGHHAEPYLGLAAIAVQRGDLDRAFELYQKAAGVEANDKALSGLAMMEVENGDYASAYDHYHQALLHNPENEVALFGLVQTGHVLERLEEILPHLYNYLELDPQKSQVRYSLAACLSVLNREEEAKEQLEFILEAEPENEEARELYAQL